MAHKVLKIAAGGALLANAAYTGIGALLGHQIVKPKHLSLKEEKQWEIEHETWDNYDNYTHVKYKVIGKKDYVLNCEYTETNPGSKKIVILSHGYTSNRYGAVKYVGVFSRLGYNCIIYDCRGHGSNQPAATTIGNLESQDLNELIKDTYTRFGEDIELGLHGESMGAATSISVLRYHPKVRFVVADCPFASLPELLKYLYDKKHIGFLLDPVRKMTKKFYHVNLKKTCPRAALAGNKVPVCLIHGTADTYIPPQNSDQLAEATSGYKEVHKIEGARHAESRFVLGEEKYAQIVGEFLKHVEEQEALANQGNSGVTPV